MKRQALQSYLDELLDSRKMKDYCPNGLQVEGREELGLVVCGVTASQALIDAAIALKASAIIVHHGLMWRGDDGRVTGHRKSRLAALLAHDINLFAYHLPLDVHPELGNNVQLGMKLGWQVSARCGEQDLICLADLPQPLSAATIAQSLARALGRVPMLIGDESRMVRKVAWCTGAAQGYFEQAILAGADLYISGEISEPTVHLARESGVAYLAAGHHATERFGVMAIADMLRQQFGLQTQFVDIDNPV